VTAILTFVLSKTGDYHNGTFERDDAYPYIALVVNCSQLVAMYCLVLFLHANQPGKG
jgi:3-hydroxymyristoyl/3-hydroxydecanoyl-(acyl carrier protein) dehydratase